MISEFSDMFDVLLMRYPAPTINFLDTLVDFDLLCHAATAFLRDLEAYRVKTSFW